MLPPLSDLHYGTTLLPVHGMLQGLHFSRYVSPAPDGTFFVAGVVTAVQKNPRSMRGPDMHTIFLRSGSTSEQQAAFTRSTKILRDIIICDQVDLNLHAVPVVVVDHWLPFSSSSPNPLSAGDGLHRTPLIALEHTELCSECISSFSLGTFVSVTCTLYRMQDTLCTVVRRAYSIFPLSFYIPLDDLVKQD